MKLIKLTAVSGLMVISSQVFCGVVDNSQIMPPPGPYQSIMSNTPPAFVPYGSLPQKSNPNNKNLMPQAFNHFPADTRAMMRPAVQPPEWVINQQKAVKENIEKMLKENTELFEKNQKQYEEYIKKSEERAEKYAQENTKRIEENNKKMKEAWKNMLDQYAKNQKQQIQDAKNIPEWLKERMLKQHEYQVSMMNANPPMNMNIGERPMVQMPRMPRNNYQQNFNRNQQQQGGYKPNPAGAINNPGFMQHPVQPGMRGYPQHPPQAQIKAPSNNMQFRRPLMPEQRFNGQVMRGQPYRGQPFMGQPYPVAPGMYPVAPYNQYRR